jgi:hypothetical protein
MLDLMDPSKKAPRLTLSLRVEPETMQRLHRLVAHLSRRYPTFRMSNSDAARVALEEGLTSLEKKWINRIRGKHLL